MVSEKKNTVRWPAGLVLGLCLALACTPRQPPLDLYLDAVALRELGQEQLAAEKLEAVVTADPGFTMAYSELGKAREKLGAHEEAAAAFKQAAKLDPWSFEYQFDLARMYEALAKYSQAGDAYARAAELDPNRFDAHAGAADSYVKAGQFAKAGAHCEQGGPEGQRELLPVLARAYEGQKDYDRAVEVYERLWALDRRDPNVALAFGVACVKAERYDRARELLVAAAQLCPTDGKPLRHLGYCLILLEDVEQAMQSYQKAIDLDGDDWEAYRGLGVACMMKARQTDDERWREQAIRHWRRSLLLEPDQPRRQVLERLIRENAKQQNPLQGLSY